MPLRSRQPVVHCALDGEHGPAMPMPELRQVVAADCPRMVAQAWHDVCGDRFPGLVGLAL